MNVGESFLDSIRSEALEADDEVQCQMGGCRSRSQIRGDGRIRRAVEPRSRPNSPPIGCKIIAELERRGRPTSPFPRPDLKCSASGIGRAVGMHVDIAADLRHAEVLRAVKYALVSSARLTVSTTCPPLLSDSKSLLKV